MLEGFLGREKFTEGLSVSNNLKIVAVLMNTGTLIILYYLHYIIQSNRHLWGDGKWLLKRGMVETMLNCQEIKRKSLCLIGD